MKIKIFLILGIAFIFSLSFAQESIAITLKVKGIVELNRDEKVAKINSGSELIDKDKLESKEESFAAVKFIDGSSVIKLFPNSILTIQAEKSGDKLNKKNYLDMGELWAKVTKKTGGFEIDTPTTVVSVKGTELLVSVDENGETDLFTLKGEVSIRNKRDDNQMNVPEGYKAHSSGEGEILVSLIQEGDIDDETQEFIENEVFKTLEIELKNEDGENKTIKLNFE